MKKGLKLPVILTFIFLASYLVYFAAIGNYEFTGYIIITAIVFYALIKLDKIYNFPLYSIWLFVGWVVLHMLGGSIIIDNQGSRLYAWQIFNWVGDPYYLLKYDQIVHAYCYVVISILIFFALKKHFKNNQTNALVVFTILASIGIGMLNEVIEFAMVVFADASKGVGGYYNTALDIVFNLIGAIIGALFAKKNS